MANYQKHEAQDWAAANLRGQWTTLVTPFTVDNKFDDAGMRRNIQHIRKLGTKGGGCTWGMDTLGEDTDLYMRCKNEENRNETV